MALLMAVSAAVENQAEVEELHEEEFLQAVEPGQHLVV
jgi:hypothetical protein